jgi:hypothetical protein
MGRACSTNRAKRNAYKILVAKSEGKRLLRRPRRKWVDNIKMDLQEIGWGGMDWIGLAKDRDQWKALVNMVIKARWTRKVADGTYDCSYELQAATHCPSNCALSSSLDQNLVSRPVQNVNFGQHWSTDFF